MPSGDEANQDASTVTGRTYSLDDEIAALAERLDVTLEQAEEEWEVAERAAEEADLALGDDA